MIYITRGLPILFRRYKLNAMYMTGQQLCMKALWHFQSNHSSFMTIINMKQWSEKIIQQRLIEHNIS